MQLRLWPEPGKIFSNQLRLHQIQNTDPFCEYNYYKRQLDLGSDDTKMEVLLALNRKYQKHSVPFLWYRSIHLYPTSSDLKVKGSSSPNSFSSLSRWCMDSMIVISKARFGAWIRFCVPMTFRFLMLIWRWSTYVAVGSVKRGWLWPLEVCQPFVNIHSLLVAQVQVRWCK